MSTFKHLSSWITLSFVVLVTVLALKCSGFNSMPGTVPVKKLQLDFPVKVLKCSNDGSVIAVGVRSGEILLIDSETWEVKSRFFAAKNLVSGISFSPDDKLIACCSETDTVSIFDVKTHQLIHDFHDPDQEDVRSIQFSPDGKLFCVGTADGSVRLISTESWNVTVRFHEANAKMIIPGGTPIVYKVAFLPNGREIAIGLHHGTLLLSTNGLTEIKAFPVTKRAIDNVTVSYDGKWMATAGEVSQMWRLDGQGETVSIRNEYRGSFRSLDFSSDGKFLLVGIAGNRDQHSLVLVYSLEQGRVITQFSCHADSLADACFIPGTHRIVTAAYDGAVLEWSLNLEEPK
jgi:WD40 repeat protein